MTHQPSQAQQPSVMSLVVRRLRWVRAVQAATLDVLVVLGLDDVVVGLEARLGG